MFERKKVKVSIIIPSWFKADQDGKYGENETFWFAAHCMRRLKDVTPRESYELIIIDNGSTLTREDLGSNDDRYLMTPNGYWSEADIVVRNRENLGFAPACNQGFAIARGKYVICLNNDILLFPGWLEALIEPFNSKKLFPPAGVIMPALVKDTRDAREALEMKEVDLKQNFDALGPRAEFGSLWIMEKSLMDKIKQQDGYVFDENFKLGFGEDRDLWDRVRLQGYETYRTHKTRVFHQGNMSIGKVKDRQKYTFPNREYLAKKRAKRKT